MPRQRLAQPVNVAVLAVALGVTALDTWSKWWARRDLVDAPRHLVGPLWLRLTYNSGISFSLNRRGPVLTTLAVLAIVLVVLFVAAQALPGLPTVGFGLLLGGGVSNEINRLLSMPHRVTDFISVGWFTVFNLADVAVTVGFCILMVALVRGSSLVEW